MHGDGLSLHPATAVMSVLLLYLQHYSNSFFLLIAYVCFVHCSIPVIPPGRAPPCSVTFDSYYRSR